jgi:transposase
MAEIEKKTKRYPTDLTDEEWARIEPFLPAAAKSGRRLADVAEGLSALADGLLVVSPVRAALPVPDHPRRGADA